MQHLQMCRVTIAFRACADDAELRCKSWFFHKRNTFSILEERSHPESRNEGRPSVRSGRSARQAVCPLLTGPDFVQCLSPGRL